MRIGIIADTHDNRRAVDQAIDAFERNEVTVVIHCGDITSPETVRLFSGFEVHAVLGNNDRPYQDELATAIDSIGPASTLHGLFADLTLDEVRIAVLHGVVEETVFDHATSGDYEYVFHGHFHEARETALEHTTVINPGAHRSVVVLDTIADNHWFVHLDTEQHRGNESDTE